MEALDYISRPIAGMLALKYVLVVRYRERVPHLLKESHGWIASTHEHHDNTCKQAQGQRHTSRVAAQSDLG